jgi:hypothetical protein
MVGPLLRGDNPKGDIFLAGAPDDPDDRIPRAHAYSNSAAIIAGS